MLQRTRPPVEVAAGDMDCHLRLDDSLVEVTRWAAGRSLPGMSLAFALMAAINGSTGSCATLSHVLKQSHQASPASEHRRQPGTTLGKHHVGQFAALPIGIPFPVGSPRRAPETGPLRAGEHQHVAPLRIERQLWSIPEHDVAGITRVGVSQSRSVNVAYASNTPGTAEVIDRPGYS